VNSLDTNILLYATNEDCAEHQGAIALVQQALNRSAGWIVSDQVYFEFYRLLRNPKVLEHPLAGSEAWRIIDFYRHQSGWMHCCYENTYMGEIAAFLDGDDFPPARTFDVVLAVTLKKNGVDTFYTHNKKDFEPYRWFTLIDPTE
jgi:toxin-antitoxin system PIN domain toxin